VREKLAPTGRPISELLTDIVRNFQDILRFEIRLAQSEAREKMRAAASAGVLLIIAAIGALLSALFILLSILIVLSHVMAPWIAALAIAAMMALVAAATLGLGARWLKNLQRSAVAAAMKEDAKWAKPTR
jgi:hypothetical protein